MADRDLLKKTELAQRAHDYEDHQQDPFPLPPNWQRMSPNEKLFAQARWKLGWRNRADHCHVCRSRFS